MGTTIQINSLEALERMIGGDSETEIQIRYSIIQEFAKKHLKALVPEVVAGSLDELKKEVRQVVLDEYFQRSKHGWGVMPNEMLDEFKTGRIKENFEQLFAAAIQEIGNGVAHKVLSPEFISQYLSVKFDEIVEKKALEIVNQRMKGL